MIILQISIISEHDNRLPSTSKSSYPRQNFAMGGRHKDKKYRNSGKFSLIFPSSLAINHLLI